MAQVPQSAHYSPQEPVHARDIIRVHGSGEEPILMYI